MTVKELNKKWEADYDKRLKAYNAHVKALEAQRKEFYEKNPDFPYPTMFMNVIAPPCRIEINEI